MSRRRRSAASTISAPSGQPTLDLMQDTLEISNAVAAELAGISDGVLDALRERPQCTVRLRGNQLTLEGDEQHVENARAVIDELVELVEGGHQIGRASCRERV